MTTPKRVLQTISAKVTPVQLLVIGYVALCILGTFLLRLPAASAEGTSQNLVDALFTATSAVSTTGLVVEDTGTFYSFFGQATILILFQIGGLGYMAFVVLMVYALGRTPSLVSAVTLKESLSGVTLGNMKQYLRAVFLFTLLFEGIGALILTVYWLPQFSATKSAYFGIFHSISAFCTSGFSLFSSSFGEYQMETPLLVVVSSISIAGGLGFIVLSDIKKVILQKAAHVHPHNLSVHTRLSLLISFLLMGCGALIIFAVEPTSPAQKGALSWFQSVSASTTTGFSSVHIGQLATPSLIIILVLMIIGASPGGSGGGIKVTAFGSTVLAAWAMLRGRRDVTFFNRRISPHTVQRSFIIGLLALLWVVLISMVLTATEEATFLEVLFEVVSAVGTVGLSTGITSSLSIAGKLLITITMLIGRVGPLAIAFTLLGEQKAERFHYPQGEVFIG